MHQRLGSEMPMISPTYSLAQYDLQRSLHIRLSRAFTDMHSLGAQSASASILPPILNRVEWEVPWYWFRTAGHTNMLISIAYKSLHAAFSFFPFFFPSGVESSQYAQIQHWTCYFKKCSWLSKTTSNAGIKVCSARDWTTSNKQKRTKKCSVSTSTIDH